ncbi:tyrosine--tRNA ligase [Leucobacter sp. UCMA 4100]|uniref:tyrosine--tRNA ligase n=1 Tax=Leucobacter sp. UCMA 4100 TaxID=2810534 RepID=UPI0022EAEDBB|nr:tyrosine--tRNA ligase [Leucobacter sp. UCMA 4100]MDA3147566.1 tyrosine--tRNA ligase [Leucobacter sp. UCMA 4100]
MNRSELLAAQRLDDSFETLWDELQWRGLIHVSTDQGALAELLEGESFTYYCGFDPTAASLHLGHLVQLLLMRRLQLKGHKPLGLVGGSTGLIGDPRPTSERTLNSPETVGQWVSALQEQVSRYLSFEGENAARLVNNLDWTAPLSAIDFLREIGKYFRVGTMIKKDIVAKRLNSDEGISYTEFSYQILQGLDFLELHRQYGCMLQSGGSDQWGNLTSGTELIRKVEGAQVHAIGTPLITNSDGTKFGKSEGNAIWLNPDMCSPYAFYQFWINTHDDDVVERLKVFTFLTRAEIEDYERQVQEEPFKRAAQRRLAFEVTSLVHSPEVAQAQIDAAEALFGKGELVGLDIDTIRGALEELPRAEGKPGDQIAELLTQAGVVKSVSEARRAIAQGGVYVNNEQVQEQDAVLVEGQLLHGTYVVLRRGKRTLAAVQVATD